MTTHNPDPAAPPASGVDDVSPDARAVARVAARETLNTERTGRRPTNFELGVNAGLEMALRLLLGLPEQPNPDDPDDTSFVHPKVAAVLEQERARLNAGQPLPTFGTYSVKLTGDEMDKVMRAAGNAGLHPSAYMRRAVLLAAASGEFARDWDAVGRQAAAARDAAQALVNILDGR